MTPAPPTRSPGSMTVSFLFGWQHILIGLALLLALAALFLLLLAAGRGGRSEWRAFLDARSSAALDVETDDEAATAEPAAGVSRLRPR